MNVDLAAQAQDMFEQLVAWRRDLHRHPEIGFKETRTAEVVARHLGELGYQVHTGIAHTGVVGLLSGPEGEDGPTVLLRFDMDALPIQEENETDYVSQIPGMMHACGHDGHVAIGLGTASLLSRHRQALKGTVKLVFQPGEEGMNGAEVMVNEGTLDQYGPRPEAAFALHVWNDLPAGQVQVTPGPVLAAAERWTLKVTGRGGHGASPHQTVDPIVASSHIVTALQSIVSRNVPPLKTAVVTVGSIHGGTAFNIIPPEVELQGTIRTFEPEVRQTVLARMGELIEGVAASLGAQADLTLKALTPAVVNDPAKTQLMRSVAEAVVGADKVDSGLRSMGSEDMAFFLREVPGCFLLLGSANAERELNYPHHHPRFDFDEVVLPQGVAIMAGTAMRYLEGAKSTPTP